jgi:hypothetical protein
MLHFDFFLRQILRAPSCIPQVAYLLFSLLVTLNSATDASSGLLLFLSVIHVSHVGQSQLHVSWPSTLLVTLFSNPSYHIISIMSCRQIARHVVQLPVMSRSCPSFHPPWLPVISASCPSYQLPVTSLSCLSYQQAARRWLLVSCPS